MLKIVNKIFYKFARSLRSLGTTCGRFGVTFLYLTEKEGQLLGSCPSGK